MREKGIKILYFNTSEKIGGGEISLITFLLGLKKNQYEITVVCPPGELTKRLREININVTPVKIELLKAIRIKCCDKKLYLFNPFTCIYNVFILFSNAYRLNSFIRKTNPHLIHANTLEAMGIIVIPAVLNNTPIIWHMRILPDKKSPTGKFYIKFLSKFAKKIIAISGAIKERLLSLGVVSNKIEIVYNPIDTNVFAPCNKYECRKKLNLPIHTTIVGSLGRLNSEKGYEVFLKAAVITKKQYPNIHFLIAGKEWEKNYRKKLINISRHLGLSPNLILINWHQNASCLISSLDILILIPKGREGFGRTLAEGMACEVPVIGSSVGGIKEIIDDKKNGLLVSPGDETAVAEAIDALLKNQKLALQLAKQGRKKVKAKFTINLHVKRIEKIYAKIL